MAAVTQIHARRHGVAIDTLRSGPALGGYAPLAFSIVNGFCIAFCMGAQGAQQPKTAVSGPGSLHTQPTRLADTQALSAVHQVRAHRCA
jgi:hypothetical protein